MHFGGDVYLFLPNKRRGHLQKTKKINWRVFWARFWDIRVSKVLFYHSGHHYIPNLGQNVIYIRVFFIFDTIFDWILHVNTHSTYHKIMGQQWDIKVSYFSKKSNVTQNIFSFNYHLPITTYQLPLTNYHLPTTTYQLPPTIYQLPHINYQLPTTTYQLPTTNYHLPTTTYQLPPINYHLPPTTTSW